MIEPEVLTEVPAELKRLAKQVVRGFYGIEHALALDVLIRNPCVREEDMQELLKFDRKQLRSVLNTLKADKFVKCRMRVETAPDGKTTRHNYYFINYRPRGQPAFDPMTGTFRCTFCQTEVEEDESVCPDARTLVARFNEQIEPIYALLRETEDINLSHDLLEPEPTEIPALKQSRERAAAAGLAGGPHREAWANKGSTYSDLYSQNVEISMDRQDEQQRQVNEGKAPKERPVWLTHSTVQGAETEPDISKNRGEALPGSQDGAAGGAQTDENEEVMRALLIHEKRSVVGSGSNATAAAARGLTAATANASDSESDTSESDDDHHMAEDDDDDDDFEEVGEEHTVMVGGRPFSYREVSERPELVEQMSAQEKEAYIEMGQNLFQDMYY
ncbi:hypothetical protein WMY93_003336 [Mugilogobius chulae]|uniref:HTH TFE/IIEalpha-type domain-containing protein n=1 Tax=Mugilogobius chulae TaxID=88201 RepID=A0AAW0Q4L6_9GOBI